MSENGAQKPTPKPRKCPPRWSEEQKQLYTVRSQVQLTISSLLEYKGTITEVQANGNVSAETALEILCKGKDILRPLLMLISIAVQTLSPTGSIRSSDASEQLTPEFVVSPPRSRSSSTASATSNSGSRRNSRSVSSEIQSVQQLETIADTIMCAGIQTYFTVHDIAAAEYVIM